MSEEVKPPQSPEIPNPKQYLLMADEVHMTLLSKIMPGIRFVQVEGMPIENNDTHIFLVNRLPKTDAAIKPIEELKVS